MVDDIRFNSIVIAESLAQGEVKTGTFLHGRLQSLLDDLPMVPVHVFHEQLDGAEAFRKLVHEISTKVVTAGMLPILHIETHGSQEDGLWFADESCIGWEEFCDLITPLNRVMEFRLTVVISACFGADILTGVRLNRPAPCFAFIAPTEEINPAEAMGRFRDMYTVMLKTLNASETFDAMTRDKLTQGALIPQTAQNWFEMLMSEYLSDHTTPKAIKDFALRQFINERSSGNSVATMRAFKRLFKVRLPGLVEDYFETFFMLREVPGNRRRFAPLWAQMERKIATALRGHKF